jgi:uncharacterized protein YycO
MNERIRELADQAGIHFGRSATLDGNNIARFVTTSDMEKFAELIVRECAELATKEYNNRGAIHGNDLLQHFGVAE